METTSQISISAHIHHSPHIRISLHAALHRISLHINLFLLPNPSHQNFLFQNFYAHNNFFFQYSPHTPRHFLTLWYQNIHNITQTRSKAKPFSFNFSLYFRTLLPPIHPHIQYFPKIRVE